MSGIAITFTIAGPGAFPSGSSTATATSTALGVAPAPLITATGAGSIVVTASATGATAVTLPTITVAAPAPALTADVVVTPGVLSGKVTLTVAATNTGLDPVTLVIKTKYGTKTFTGVAPGATVSNTFKALVVSIPAGTATVVVSNVSGQQTITAPYSAFTAN